MMDWIERALGFRPVIRESGDVSREEREREREVNQSIGLLNQRSRALTGEGARR